MKKDSMECTQMHCELTSNIPLPTPCPNNNSLNLATQHQPTTQIWDTDNISKRVCTSTEMVHALPQRIARSQQRLQPNNLTVCRKWKNGSARIKRIPMTIDTGHDNSNIKVCSKISDCENKIKSNQNNMNDTAVAKTISDTTDTSSSMEGLFGWTLIDQIYVPYIFRADNKQYVCVRILEQKILNKYPNIFPEELAKREPLSSSQIQPSECKVFNNLLQMQNKDQNIIFLVNQDDVVVLLSEFLKFYNVVRKLFPECAKSAKHDLKRREKCKSGWLQINNTVIPYINRSNDKFLPLAVLKHAASIDIEADGVLPFDEECHELNVRCAEEGFHFIFKTNTRLVSVQDIKKVCDIQIIELPENNPLQYAQYLVTDEQTTEGMKINTQNNYRDRHSGFLRQCQTSACETVPHQMKPGPPNVTIVPHNKHHSVDKALSNATWHSPHSTEGHSIISNHHMIDSYGSIHHLQRGPFSSPGQHDICNLNQHFSKVNHSGECERTPVPTEFISSLPPGQNINVNYGINIQNINHPYFNSTRPVGQASNVLSKDSQQNCNIRQMHSMAVTSNARHYQNTFNVRPPMPPQTTKNTFANYHDKRNVDTMSGNLAAKIVESKPDHQVLICNQDGSNYHRKQRQAIEEIKGRIKSVWIGHKNISCLQLNTPGRTGRYSLVEAICKLYFSNRTVGEFLFTIDKALVTVTCTELEEQALIEYYQLPVKVLRCNKMVELSAFEKMFYQLVQILGDGYSRHNQLTNNSCLFSSGIRSNSHETASGTFGNPEQGHGHKAGSEENNKEKAIVLDE